MQTTKFLVVIGTVAVLAASDSCFAGPDSEAQAKMREAMRLKMEELKAPAAPVVPAAPAPAPAAPPKAVEQPAPRPATVVVPVTTPSQEEQNTARLIEELRRQQEAAKKTAAPAPTPAPAPVAAPTVVTAPKTAAPKQSSGFSDVSDLEDDAKAARLREALRQQLAAEKAVPAPTPVVAAPVKPVATPAPGTPAPPVKPVATVKPAPAVAVAAPSPQPLVANIPTAASPLTGSKQDRLAELLRRYKADAITPQEYHTQRAAIIAE